MGFKSSGNIVNAVIVSLAPFLAWVLSPSEVAERILRLVLGPCYVFGREHTCFFSAPRFHPLHERNAKDCYI
jgi:hypothetical protein